MKMNSAFDREDATQEHEEEIYEVDEVDDVVVVNTWRPSNVGFIC